jgi:hypothetical protein
MWGCLIRPRLGGCWIGKRRLIIVGRRPRRVGDGDGDGEG